MRLLWGSVANKKAFKVTRIHRGILRIVAFKVLTPERSFVLDKSNAEDLL